MAVIRKYNEETKKWEVVDLSVANALPEAPADGKMYGRKNGLWKRGKEEIPVVSHGNYETYASISPNVLHVFGTTYELTLELVDSEAGVLQEYMVQFNTYQDGCTLTLPESIMWLNGTAPEIKGNKTYQLSIVNDLAVMGEF